MLDSVVERVRLAGVRLGKNQHLPGGCFAGERRSRDFERTVAGAIVNHNHAQVRIVRVQRGAHRSLSTCCWLCAGISTATLGLYEATSAGLP